MQHFRIFRVIEVIGTYHAKSVARPESEQVKIYYICIYYK